MRVEVVLEGELAQGQHYLVDFGDIKQAIEPIRQQLDHKLLNDIEGLEVPTVEHMSRWIFQKLEPALPFLVAVRIYETPQNMCEYRPRN